MLRGILFGYLFSASFLGAQIVGSGYTAPAPVSVAPGQIATFYVAGLPSTSGITATLQQPGGKTLAPIQSLRTLSLCPDNFGTSLTGCGSLTAVTVQIPYELMPICPLCDYLVANTPSALTISQNGQAASAFELTPLSDEIHVLKSCDVALGVPPPQQPNLSGLPCTPLVTHPDGSLVSAASPANAGETLTMWAFGLGQTSPAATTGQPASGAPTAQTFNLDFNYQINALPAKPFTGEPDRVPLHPLYSGLAPGYIGLYQVNFTVPPGPANGIEQCSTAGGSAAGTSLAQSNLTVSIGGQFSFDGAGICVATQIPVD